MVEVIWAKFYGVLALPEAIELSLDDCKHTIKQWYIIVYERLNTLVLNS